MPVQRNQVTDFMNQAGWLKSHIAQRSEVWVNAHTGRIYRFPLHPRNLDQCIDEILDLTIPPPTAA